jgi:hypothetical protein
MACCSSTDWICSFFAANTFLAEEPCSVCTLPPDLAAYIQPLQQRFIADLTARADDFTRQIEDRPPMRRPYIMSTFSWMYQKGCRWQCGTVHTCFWWWVLESEIIESFNCLAIQRVMGTSGELYILTSCPQFELDSSFLAANVFFAEEPCSFCSFPPVLAAYSPFRAIILRVRKRTVRLYIGEVISWCLHSAGCIQRLSL